jgi:membrane-bound lytic murein transglycosylase A
MGRRGLVLAAVLLLAACGEKTAPPPVTAPVPPPPDHLSYIPVSFSQLPGWDSDRLAEAVPALRKSCDRLTQLPVGQPVGNDGAGGVAGDWSGPCGALRWVKLDDEIALRTYLRDWFQPFRIGNGHGDDGRFTGYYEAELHGSRHKSAKYHIPLLGRPAGWAADPPEGGPTRAQIEAGALEGKAPVLLWVDDAVDLHILQIQGSGRVLLDDGSVQRVAYAGNNGREFLGLGKILAAHGKLAANEATMPAIRAWLKAHPAEAPALMAENERYIFFRPLAGEGPVGALTVPLTAGRSLAIDPKFVPLGVPVWLDTVDPDGVRLQKLMVAQDTGRAIKGAVRADIFWGSGEAAFDKAGRMNSRGGYYVLLPAQRSGPVAAVDPALAPAG